MGVNTGSIAFAFTACKLWVTIGDGAGEGEIDEAALAACFAAVLALVAAIISASLLLASNLAGDGPEIACSILKAGGSSDVGVIGVVGAGGRGLDDLGDDVGVDARCKELLVTERSLRRTSFSNALWCETSSGGKTPEVVDSTELLSVVSRGWFPQPTRGVSTVFWAEPLGKLPGVI